MERDPFKHGFPENAWQAAKEEARQILYRTAKRQRTISYSELVENIDAVRMDAHDVRLAHFLGQIAREDDDNGLGLTTVIVVHKTGDMLPGPGFFEMAESQGRVFDDELAFWSSELTRVHKQWYLKK